MASGEDKAINARRVRRTTSLTIDQVLDVTATEYETEPQAFVDYQKPRRGP